MYQFFNDKYFKISLIALGIITLFIPICGALLYGYIEGDPAYFLCMVERIAEGNVLYSDVHCGYTPLWFYMMAGIKVLLHIPYGCYEFYLFLHFVFQFLGAFFLYKFSREINIPKSIAIFGGWLYIITFHWLRGNWVAIDAPSIFFGILSCWLVLKCKNLSFFHYLWIGVLACCSFLCKQYGFGFLFLCLYLIIFVNKSCNIKTIGLFLFGYFSPIALCLLFWKGDFVSIVFSGYGTKTAADVGYDVSVSAKLWTIANAIKYFSIRICPATLIAIFFICHFIKEGRLSQFIFCYSGILGFSLMFWFNTGLHYYLFMMAFGVLLLEMLLSIEMPKWQKIFVCILLFYTVSIQFYSVYKNRVYKEYYKLGYRGEKAIYCKRAQKEMSKSTLKYLSQDDIVWIQDSGLYFLYYMCNLTPPNIETIGYSMGRLGLSEEKAEKQILASDYVICSKKVSDWDKVVFTERLQNYVKQFPKIEVEETNVVIYKLK